MRCRNHISTSMFWHGFEHAGSCINYSRDDCGGRDHISHRRVETLLTEQFYVCMSSTEFEEARLRWPRRRAGNRVSNTIIRRVEPSRALSSSQPAISRKTLDPQQQPACRDYKYFGRVGVSKLIQALRLHSRQAALRLYQQKRRLGSQCAKDWLVKYR